VQDIHVICCVACGVEKGAKKRGSTKTRGKKSKKRGAAMRREKKMMYDPRGDQEIKRGLGAGRGSGKDSEMSGGWEIKLKQGLLDGKGT